MANPIIDLTGQRFGRLTVIGEAGRRKYNGEVAWRCRCDCGAFTTVASSDLRRGKSKSCASCGYKFRRKENRK